MKKSVTLTGLGAVALVALGLYVWLTPYKYDHVKVGDNNVPVRINRITGKTEVFMMAAGWMSFKDDSGKKVENPKPWNARALTASYEGMHTLNAYNRDIVFWYTVENTTDQDYRVETGDGISLTGKLAQPQSLSGFDSSEKIHYPIFIPSKQRLRVDIEIQNQYPDSGGNQPPTKVLEECVRTHFGNLDGFVLFDSNNRYQINFPKGW